MRRAQALGAVLVRLDKRSPRPLYRQLYEGLREAILERRLRPGERLASTRTLARELGVSRLPVLNAFEQLLAEGYFESRRGAGTFVARSLPGGLAAERPARPGVPPRPGARRTGRTAGALVRAERDPWLEGVGAFRMSQPALEGFPLRVWARLLARHGRNPRANLLRYGDPLGHLPFRQAMAAYLRAARGVRCEPEQLMVVSGSQQALAVAAHALLDPGDQVWVEEPGYGGARDMLRLAGARLAPIPVDGEGLDVGGGAARCPRARAVYVTPSHQYPLGATLSASRRLQLLDWARRSGAWILEDDYDSEYRYESQPIAALQGLDRDARVVYVGTLSKILLPALRLGYLVIPEDLVPRFAAVREALDIFPSPLFQAVLADFVQEGHFARHVRRMRLLYGERRDLLAAELRRELGDQLELLGGEAGMHLVAAFRQPRDDQRLARLAARQGLWTMPLSSCYLGRPTRSGLVLGYGGTNLAEIREGVRRLRELLTGV